MSEYMVEKLEQILEILNRRSERLDRFEAALAALGHRLNEPRNDLCGKHTEVEALGCVLCTQTRLSEIAGRVDFLTEGLKQAQALATARGAKDVADYVESLLNPPQVKPFCGRCGNAITVLADKLTPGVALDTGIELSVVDRDGATGPILLCVKCYERRTKAEDACMTPGCSNEATIHGANPGIAMWCEDCARKGEK